MMSVALLRSDALVLIALFVVLRFSCKALLTENQALRDRLQALESAAP